MLSDLGLSQKIERSRGNSVYLENLHSQVVGFDQTTPSPATPSAFNPCWYLAADPIPGPIKWGSNEGRKPNPQFDPTLYRATYPAMVAAKVEPFQYYGALEGRLLTPEADYLTQGHTEGRAPKPPPETDDRMTGESDEENVCFVSCCDLSATRDFVSHPICRGLARTNFPLVPCSFYINCMIC